MTDSKPATHNTPPEEETPDSAVPGTSKQPYPNKNYEENPLDDQALLKAAESVPVKDYSDYEITIESKTDYADALFGSDDDLAQALAAARSEKQTQQQSLDQSDTAQPAEPEKQNPSDAPNAKAAKTYDFSVFTRADEVTGVVTDVVTDVVTNVVADAVLDDAGTNAVNNGAADNHSELAAQPDTYPTEHAIYANVNDSTVASDLDNEDANEPTQLLFDDEQPEQVIEPPPPAEAKTLAEKIKLKAKQQFEKSKANFDEYTGRSLPERELPLDFTFPIQKPKKEFDEIVSSYSIRKLFENKGKSDLSIFKQADIDLTKLNKCQMSASARQGLLDTYSEALIPKTLEAIASFERKPVLAGDAKRLQLAEHSLAIYKSLVNGYRQVYSSFYEAANVIYGPQRNSANAILFRLFSLLLLEAKLCVALHSKIPTSSIKTINKLFTACRLYEPQLLSQRQVSIIDSEITSIKALYFHFQVLAAVDTATISSIFYRVVSPYLQDKLELLAITEPAQACEPHQHFWVIAHDQTEPAKSTQDISTSAIPEQGFAPVIIDITRFSNAIKREYAQCIANIDDPQWKPSDRHLAAIKPHYRLTLLAGLNNSLRQHELGETVPFFSIYQPTKIRSYTGLDRIYGHLNFSYELATKKPVPKGETAKELPEKPVLDKAQWHLAKDETEYRHVQLHEADCNLPIDIGQLLLMIEPEVTDDDQQTTEDVPEQTVLGIVLRVERHQGDKLNVIVKKLGDEIAQTQLTHAQLTHAQLTQGSEPSAPKPVVVVANGLSLLVAADLTVDPKQQQMTLTLPDGSERHAAVQQVLWTTQKVQVLRVQ